MNLLQRLGEVGLRWFERGVRRLELQLTGQSEYRLITSETPKVTVVDDRIKGNRLLEQVRRELAQEFTLHVRAPVILELVAPDSPQARKGDHDVLGYYRPQPWGEEMVHTIFVRKDLEAPFFCGIVAHELAHAWEREIGCLTSQRALREGFARWIEYKTLLRHGARSQAGRLLRIRTWRFGRAVRGLLELEDRVGVAGVVEYIRGLQ